MTTNTRPDGHQIVRSSVQHQGRLSNRNRCQQCAARASALCGNISDESAEVLSRITHRVRVPEGRVVFGEYPHAKSFAIIISGVVKLLNTRPDGQHQIVGLQFPSDFVGRPYAQSSNLIAEAATDLELCYFSGRAFEELLTAQPEIENALLKQVLKDLDHAREWMSLFGRSCAQERVCQFLLSMWSRMGASAEVCDGAGKSATFVLPLSRTEIANCLGLRIETISRQLSSLKAAGVVTTGRRRLLEIKDIDKLRGLSIKLGD